MQAEADIAVPLDTVAALRLKGRRDVLKALQSRHLTATEVAEKLNIPKSSAHFHLQALTEVGLIERETADRLWVTYRLTSVGRHLVQHDRPRITLLLGAALLSGLGAAASFVVWRSSQPQPPSNPYVSERLVEPVLSTNAPAFIMGCILGSLAVVLATWAVVRARRAAGSRLAALRSG